MYPFHYDKGTIKGSQITKQHKICAPPRLHPQFSPLCSDVPKNYNPVSYNPSKSCILEIRRWELFLTFLKNSSEKRSFQFPEDAAFLNFLNKI